MLWRNLTGYRGDYDAKVVSCVRFVDDRTGAVCATGYIAGTGDIEGTGLKVQVILKVQVLM